MFLSFLKKNSAHFLAVLAFLLITVTFLSPIFFERKELVAGDVMQGLGGSHELMEYEKTTKQQSLWTNSLFSGMPSIMVYTRYPGNLLDKIDHYFALNLPRVADMIFISLVGFYILLSVYGVRPILAAAGAFAFAFSTYTIVSIEAGHNSKVHAMAFMPLIIAGIVLAYRRNILLGGLLMALGLALNLLTNHVQITFYSFLTALFFIASELFFSVKEKTIKRFFLASAGLGVAALVAVGTHAGYLMSVTEYSQYSIRGKSELTIKDPATSSENGLGKDYAYDWSYTPSETMTLLIPRYYGGSSNENLGTGSNIYEWFIQKGVQPKEAKDYTKSLPTYWGELPFTSGPIYIGAILLFLFVLGLLVLEGKHKYWILSATVFSLFLIWGKNFAVFNYFLFDYVPGFNKFRAVMMAVVIAQLTIPLMALLALEKILSSPFDVQKLKKQLIIAFSITGGICALVFLAANFGFIDTSGPNYTQTLEDFKKNFGDAAVAQEFMDALMADRASLMSGDALRSLVLIALSAGLIFLFITNKIKETIVVVGIAVLVFVDLWSLDKKYLNASNFQKVSPAVYFTPSPADEFIKSDTAASYRVLNLSANPFTENRTSYYHKSIGGNNPAKLRRYQDLIERHLSKNNEKVLNMLNAKYVIVSPQNPAQVNPGALGNAWFVQEIKKVNSADAEIDSLQNFEPAYTAIVDVSKFPIKADKFDTSAATIALQKEDPDAPNHLVYISKSTSEKLAVFSEIYYPGWTVTIDGQPASLIRANYVLRAMYIPAGTHTIEMKFDIPTYHTGNKISLISSILLFVGAAGIVVFEVIKRKKNK